MKVTVTTSGGSASLAGTVTVTAAVTPAKQVVQVDFYVDGVYKATDSTSPYTYSWDTQLEAAGQHLLRARAFYSRNNWVDGELVVDVLDQTEPPPPPPPPPEQPPVNQTAPTISGTTTEGQTLNVSNGTWTNNPLSYTRQWLRCDSSGNNPVPIPSATGPSYVLVAADVGATIRCSVTAVNNAGPSAIVTTAQTAVIAALTPAVPVNVTVPVVSGTPSQGYTLTTSNGAWTNSPTSYTYRWLRCNTSGASCATISGATSSSYVVTSADVGSTIRAEVTAVNGSGSSSAAQSAATNVVSAPPATPPLGQSLPARLPESLGTVFYVRTDGSDSNNGLTDSAGGAWRTIQKAANTLVAGQKARVKAGNYTENVSVTRNLVGPQPATIEAFDAASKPVIIGYIRPQNSGGDAAAYWRFRNLKIDGTLGAPDPNRNYGVKVTGNATATVPHHLEFYGLEIYNVYSQVSGDMSAGVSIQGGSGASVPHHLQFWNCLTYNNGGALSSQNQTHGYYIGQAEAVVFANCISHTSRGWGFRMGSATAATQGMRNSIFVNNTVVRSTSGGGFTLFSDSGGISPNFMDGGNRFYNNIVSDVSGLYAYSSWFTGDAAPANPINLWDANLAWLYGTLTRNAAAPSISSQFVNQPIVADPLFVAKASNNFHLQAGSPAINKGLAEWTPAFDYDGNPRVTPDLGAFKA